MTPTQDQKASSKTKSDATEHLNTLDLDQALAYRIQRLARRLRHALQSFLAQHDPSITPEQWLVLFRLYGQEGMNQAALADQSLNDRPNITRILQKLEKKGQIVRAADPEDRRSHRVFLSRTGRDFVEGMLPFIQQERSRLFQGISPQRLQDLLDVIDDIEDNI